MSEIYISITALFTFTVFMSSVLIHVQVSVDDSKEEEVRHNYMRYPTVDDRWLLAIESASRSADCNVTPPDIPPGCSPHPSRELPLLFTVL